MEKAIKGVPTTDEGRSGERINWKQVAEELIGRLRTRNGYNSHMFWLDSLEERDKLAEHLKEMFGKFLEPEVEQPGKPAFRGTVQDIDAYTDRWGTA